MSEEYIKKTDVLNAINNTISHNEKEIIETKEQIHKIIGDANESKFDCVYCENIKNLYNEIRALNNISNKNDGRI